jgi:hypothetical protein
MGIKYLVPGVLLALSAIIAVWTGITVGYDHSKDTFDSPNYIPVINTVIGLLTAFVFIVNCFRLMNCIGSTGCCNTGLGVFSFLMVAGSGTALFAMSFRLDKSERDYYRDNMERFYELTLGQAIYFVLYCLLIIFQWLCKCCKCCGSCNQSDEYTLEDGHNPSTFYA